METQKEICPNCEHKISLNFCPNCGQKKYKRIDSKYIKDEIQYTLLHTNKGFFYSLKNILKNPGKTTLDYLNGNRVNHYKPILLVFVLTGISTFISYKILNMGDIMNDVYSTQLNDQREAHKSIDNMSFLYNYTTLIIMGFLPFFALSSFVAFKKEGHNYFEHVVINSFSYVLFTLGIILIVSPILYFVKDPIIYLYITLGSLLLSYPLLVWFFKGLYPQLSMKKIIWKTTVMGIFSILCYLIISISLGILVAIINYTN